jgi:hypothetical protein
MVGLGLTIQGDLGEQLYIFSISSTFHPSTHLYLVIPYSPGPTFTHCVVGQDFEYDAFDYMS